MPHIPPTKLGLCNDNEVGSTSTTNLILNSQQRQMAALRQTAYHQWRNTQIERPSKCCRHIISVKAAHPGAVASLLTLPKELISKHGDWALRGVHPTHLQFRDCSQAGAHCCSLPYIWLQGLSPKLKISSAGHDESSGGPESCYCSAVAAATA
jgi:hypothetical protein